MSRFRLRRSSRYLRISPLHLEFHSPLQPSSQVVSGAVPRLSRGISHRTHLTACVPFKPSDSEQRSPPPSYRGCWHGVSRGFLRGLGQKRMVLTLSSILPPQQEFTTRRPSSSTRRRCIRLSSIVQDSRLQPPVGVWAVSQSQCAGTPSQAPYASKPW